MGRAARLWEGGAAPGHGLLQPEGPLQVRVSGRQGRAPTLTCVTHTAGRSSRTCSGRWNPAPPDVRVWGLRDSWALGVGGGTTLCALQGTGVGGPWGRQDGQGPGFLRRDPRIAAAAVPCFSQLLSDDSSLF